MSRMVVSSLVALILMTGACKPSRSGGVTVVAADPTPVARADSEKPEPVATAPAAVEDFGSRVVARTLAPRETPKEPVARRTRPLPWHGLDSLERPEVALAAPLTSLISFTPKKRSPSRPRLLAELTPLAEYTAEPAPPQRLDLPPPRLIRTPSRDVNLPIELPVQANWRPDRASLDDPAAEYALESAQAAAAPLRQQPAPFVPINLPEPFPNRANVASPEPASPVVAPTPQAPK